MAGILRLVCAPTAWPTTLFGLCVRFPWQRISLFLTISLLKDINFKSQDLHFEFKTKF